MLMPVATWVGSVGDELPDRQRMTLERGYSIETARGRIDAEITAELVEFWTGHGALEAPAARDRAGQVVCLLRDPDGLIVATNSVYPAQVPEIGGWWFWIYRSFAPDQPALGAAPAMVAAARAALSDGFGGEPGEPVGLCWVIDETEAAVDRRSLVWPDSGMLFAGRDAEGRQLRISYFEPISGIDYPLSDRYRLRRPTAADADAAVELWTSEGVLNRQQAAERVPEISTLGVDEGGGLCGISTADLRHSERLGLELWHIRAFVAESERLGSAGSRAPSCLWTGIPGPSTAEARGPQHVPPPASTCFVARSQRPR